MIIGSVVSPSGWVGRDDHPWKKNFGVKGIPTALVFENGKEIARLQTL